MSDMSAAHCSVKPVNFSELVGWAEDDHAGAFAAFLRSAHYAEKQNYKSGVLGPKFTDLVPIFAAARNFSAMQDVNRDLARSFFENYFTPVRLIPDTQTSGFVTGFYEPEIMASRVKTPEFSVPFLRAPADLIKLDDAIRPLHLPASMAFARLTDGHFSAYFDRQSIDQGALDGQGLEIAYVAHKVDAYFAHVQGAVRLNFTDGSQIRLTYAAKSGHEFTGAGHVLIEMGALDKADITMQSIRLWLSEHPDRVDEILWRNRSYIFFREAPVDDPALGPIAAAKVPLTAQRSLAVDRQYHCFGTPFFINLQDFPDEKGVYNKLMIAQDTGSAILGPARGDLFMGSGEAAGQLAGQIRHMADFTMLVPRKGVFL